jgi:hypothetical protein
VAGPGVAPGGPSLWGSVEHWPTRELQIPVSNRAHRPYESQLGTCRICNVYFLLPPSPWFPCYRSAGISC